MQALHLSALEPVAETTADPNSYGFRRSRACRDAAGQLFLNLAKKKAPEWVLDADIAGCFDNISHEWLIANIPMDKKILGSWLKTGFVENQQWFPTEAGTPQGGIISPTLANMTLNGMEKAVKDGIADAISIKEAKKAKIPVVALADTNTDPTLVDYPIPANDDAVSSVRYILGKVKEAVLEVRPNMSSQAEQGK